HERTFRKRRDVKTARRPRYRTMEHSRRLYVTVHTHTFRVRNIAPVIVAVRHHSMRQDSFRIVLGTSNWPRSTPQGGRDPMPDILVVEGVRKAMPLLLWAFGEEGVRVSAANLDVAWQRLPDEAPDIIIVNADLPAAEKRR